MDVQVIIIKFVPEATCTAILLAVYLCTFNIQIDHVIGYII